MIQSDPEFANLSVIVDCKNIANKPKESLIPEGPPLTHCLCKVSLWLLASCFLYFFSKIRHSWNFIIFINLLD